jgi:phosphoribosylformylglycinamidine synthase
VAGLTDKTGRVFGLMPHPERFVDRTQHPHWTAAGDNLAPDGLAIFQAAVRQFR